MKILVVDDSALMRRLTSIAFAGIGFEVHQATNGREALLSVARVRPQAVLIDYQMPEMDGLQFCRQIRTHLDITLRTIPVIMLTSVTGQEMEKKALAAGVDRVLWKPMSVHEVAREVMNQVLNPRVPSAPRLSPAT